jgi:hypothetical protein
MGNPRFTYTHAKYMVLDDRRAVVGTGNLSDRLSSVTGVFVLTTIVKTLWRFPTFSGGLGRPVSRA